MNDAQRRHLAVSVRYIGQLLDEADRMIQSTSVESPFASVKGGLAATRIRAIAEAIDRLRNDLVGFGVRFHLDIGGNPVEVVHALRVQISVAAISVIEMRPRYLRGYGELDSQTQHDLDAACDELESAAHKVQEAIDRGGA